MLLQNLIEKTKLSPNNRADTIKRNNIRINLANVDLFIAIKLCTCGIYSTYMHHPSNKQDSLTINS